MADNIMHDLAMFETYEISTSPKKTAVSLPLTKPADSPLRKLRVLPDTQQTKIERIEIREKQSLASTLKILAVAVISIIIVGSFIYQRAKINDYSRQITSIMEKLEEAESENVRLNLKLESLKNPVIISRFAQKKGMIRRDSYTIQYFDLSDKDTGYVLGK